MSTRRRGAPGFGAVRIRRAVALAGCGVLAVGISACESTEQESAKIGRESQVAAARLAPAHASTSVRHTHGRGHAASRRAASGRVQSNSGRRSG